MKIEASHMFHVEPDRLWNALLDPTVLQKAMPGCEELKATGPDRYEATMTVGVAFVRGTYKGHVEISDKQPMSSYRLKAEGSGAAGYVVGDAHVALTPRDSGTTLMTISGDADVGGPVARVGQRLLEVVTRGMVKEFFSRVEQQL